MIAIEPLLPEHFDCVARWLSDPQINRWLTPEWRHRDVTGATIAIATRSRRNRFFIVRADGNACGLVALSDLDPEDATAMVWYCLGESNLSGRGIVSTAVRQLTAFAFRELHLGSVYAWTMENNVASQHVLRRSGFREVGRIRRSAVFEGKPVDRVYFDLVAQDLASAGDSIRGSLASSAQAQ